jgi:hypothetical protein
MLQKNKAKIQHSSFRAARLRPKPARHGKTQRRRTNSNTHTAPFETYVVSQAFRGLVLKEYPELEQNFFLLRLVAHALFCPRIHRKDASYALLRRKDVLRINNYAGENGRFSAKDFLDEACKAIPHLRILNEDRHEGYARGVRLELPSKLAEELKSTLWSPLTLLEQPVNFVTGKPVDMSRRRGMKEQRSQTLERIAGRVDAPSVLTPVLKRLNTVSVQTYTAPVSSNIVAAYGAVRTIEDASKQLSNLKLLRAIEIQPVPVYARSKLGQSERLYTVGASAQNLSSAPRRALLGVNGKTVFDFDLSNAQLAILSVLWDVPLLSTTLREASSFWAYLGEQLTRDISLIKPALKLFTYELAYGMNEVTARQRLAHRTDPATAQAVAGLDVFQAIVAARDKQMNMLLDGGSLRAACGRALRIQELDAPLEARQAEARSLLAQQAQSYEAQLVLKAIEPVLCDPEVAILVWQHDGFTLKFSREDALKKYLPKMQTSLQLEANRLGNIPTKLEVS